MSRSIIKKMLIAALAVAMLVPTAAMAQSSNEDAFQTLIAARP